MPQQRQHADRQRAAEGHQCNRSGRFFVFCLDHTAHRSDRRGTTDRESGGDQQRLVAGQLEPAAQPIGAGESKEHDGDGARDGHPAETGDIEDAQLEAEQHDAEAHQAFGCE